ncbi:MAG TPA: four-carbon acid sugar kinase family protein, partial [Thermomicrobiales bacterium]|nr:four-carbon acid sugar kinase family protein [Thermomicrobiales bacterium]
MTGSPRLTIIADDLTGAADTGAPFAMAGFTTTIPFGIDHPSETDVLVINTHSRGLSGSEAAAANRTAVQTWVSPVGDGSRGWVYKKIDSALRGHPAAELVAVMEAMGTHKALVAPALPAEGRTTVGGRQLLDGIPLEDTTFGAMGVTSDLVAVFDPRARGHTISLDLATVRRGPDAIGQFLKKVDHGVIIADAETEDDLAALAQALASSDLALLAGTAGLARHLARVLPGTRTHAPIRPTSLPGQGILIIAGSRDQVTANQVDHLREHGVPIVSLAAHHLDGH